MLLGLSGADIDTRIDPANLSEGAGVPHGELLVRFVDAVAAGGHDLAEVRDRVAGELGPAGLIDATAVIANFHMMTRIADGTGTPLDQGTVDMSTSLRTDLGIDDLVSTRLPSP